MRKNSGMISIAMAMAAMGAVWPDQTQSPPQLKRERQFTDADRQRLEAAAAKRARKNAKRAALGEEG